MDLWSLEVSGPRRGKRACQWQAVGNRGYVRTSLFLSRLTGAHHAGWWWLMIKLPAMRHSLHLAIA